MKWLSKYAKKVKKLKKTGALSPKDVEYWVAEFLGSTYERGMYSDSDISVMEQIELMLEDTGKPPLKDDELMQIVVEYKKASLKGNTKVSLKEEVLMKSIKERSKLSSKITVEELSLLCPTCGEFLKSKGIKSVSLSALGAAMLEEEQKDKEMIDYTFAEKNRTKWESYWQSITGGEETFEACMGRLTGSSWIDEPTDFCTDLQKFVEGSLKGMMKKAISPNEARNLVNKFMQETNVKAGSPRVVGIEFDKWKNKVMPEKAFNASDLELIENIFYENGLIGIKPFSLKKKEIVGRTKVAFSPREVQPGDYVDFGSYGKLYVVDINYGQSAGVSGEWWWVTEDESQRDNPRASGHSIKPDDAVRMIQSYEEYLDEEQYSYISTKQRKEAAISDTEAKQYIREFMQSGEADKVKGDTDLLRDLLLDFLGRNKGIRNVPPADVAKLMDAAGQAGLIASLKGKWISTKQRKEAATLTPQDKEKLREFVDDTQTDPTGLPRERAKVALEKWIQEKGYQELLSKIDESLDYLKQEGVIAFSKGRKALISNPNQIAIGFKGSKFCPYSLPAPKDLIAKPLQEYLTEIKVKVSSKDLEKIYDAFQWQGIIALSSELLEKKGVIVEEKGEWCVKSKKGKSLGCYPTKEEAVKRLQQVEFFKNQVSEAKKILKQAKQYEKEMVENKRLSSKETVEDVLNRIRKGVEKCYR